MQIYSLCSPIVIKKLFFFTLKLFFLALIFRLLTYSKGQQSFEASKTIDSSNLSARSTKSNSFWSSWIRFYKSKAITFISCKIYTSIYKEFFDIFRWIFFAYYSRRQCFVKKDPWLVHQDQITADLIPNID